MSIPSHPPLGYQEDIRVDFRNYIIQSFHPQLPIKFEAANMGGGGEEEEEERPYKRLRFNKLGGYHLIPHGWYHGRLGQRSALASSPGPGQDPCQVSKNHLIPPGACGIIFPSYG
jgi:hypothetical protein